MFRTEKLVIASGWEKWLRSAGLNSIDDIYHRADGEIVTRSGTTEVRRLTLSFEGTSHPIYVKKYWANHFSQMWSGALRGTFFGCSKVRREFENLARLRNWNLDAPAPIAYGERRHFGWLSRSFLISAGIPQPLTLDLFIREFLPRIPEPDRHRKRLELLQCLAEKTRQMHEHRFAHYDFFWRNIILSDGRFDRFFLIDAHKGRVWNAWDASRSRVIDLAALDSAASAFFSRTDRLRFFFTYAQIKALTQNDKNFLRTVLAKAEPMRSRQIKRVKGRRRTD